MQSLHQLYSTLNRIRPAAPLVLRVVIGALFVWHGIDKFDAGLTMVEGMFRTWGVPAPGFTAPLTAVLEIIAGAALIVGLLTRLAAIALGVQLLAGDYVRQARPRGHLQRADAGRRTRPGTPGRACRRDRHRDRNGVRRRPVGGRARRRRHACRGVRIGRALLLTSCGRW
jgi:hypothetical protein